MATISRRLRSVSAILVAAVLLIAFVGVFVAETPSGMRVAVTGAGPGVFRVPEMEKALAAKFAPESVAGIKVSDKGLKLPAGTYVVQVGKRKFARVHLAG